jgi:outer membrane protein OmpA-like peptidoglycan-associated protein/tetratricopeptide (TPR) repeat protein
MKKYLNLFFYVILVNFAHGQNSAIQNGDDSFEYFMFKDAIKYYEEALITASPKTEAYILTRLAECYMYSFQYKKAETYFSKLIKLGDGKAQPQSYLDYGNILKVNGKYEEAKEQFKYYMTLVKGDEYASFLNRSVSWAIQNRDSSRNYQISATDLDVSGQSVGFDFMHQGLVYAHGRNKNQQNSMTIFDLDYAAMKDSLHFLADERYLEEINFIANESSPSTTKDGSVLFFSANAVKMGKDGEIKKKQGVVASGDGVSNLQIYFAAFENGRYRNPVALSINNKQYNFTHPCITADGNVLFFASDMPGGLGGLDIYKTIKQPDGNWSQPINLGPKVNTIENDMYPYICNGNLYYSSKGINGYGGYDIYVNVLDKNLNSYNQSKNIGKPINSERDDISLISRDGGISGYFASNRGNDDGDDKVYYFVDKDILKDIIPNNLPIAGRAIIEPQQTLSKYRPQPNRINTDSIVQTTKIEADVFLLNRVFEHVIFNFNEYQITSTARIGLDSVISALKSNLKLKVLVTAHADARGSKMYNKTLSEKRAKSAKLYLIANGISAKRIISVSKGEEQLLNNCDDKARCTYAEHAMNRRVELKLIK